MVKTSMVGDSAASEAESTGRRQVLGSQDGENQPALVIFAHFLLLDFHLFGQSRHAGVGSRRPVVD